MSEPGGEASVTPELGGQTLAAVVRALFGGSWNQARAWIASSKVSVDGAVSTDDRRLMRAGARVALRMNTPRPLGASALRDDQVVHLDDDVIVIDKPPGVSTVAFDANDRDTLDERVRKYLERRDRTGGQTASRAEVGVVHRLDKETSGLVVFARHVQAKAMLDRQFRAHDVLRRYVAVALGEVTAATHETHLVPDRGDGLRGSSERRKGARRRQNGGNQAAALGGQLAITHVEPLEKLRGATLISCRLETGRTHQIRIHLSEAGHPIVGEPVYVRDYTGPKIPAPRLMLHAMELGFAHPRSGLPVRWERPVPADLRALIAALR